MAVVSCSSSDKLPPTETPHSLPLLWLNLDSGHPLPEKVWNVVHGAEEDALLSEVLSERCIFIASPKWRVECHMSACLCCCQGYKILPLPVLWNHLTKKESEWSWLFCVMNFYLGYCIASDLCFAKWLYRGENYVLIDFAFICICVDRQVCQSNI